MQGSSEIVPRVNFGLVMDHHKFDTGMPEATEMVNHDIDTDKRR